jgi:Domain of unknown function (DUF4386)
MAAEERTLDAGGAQRRALIRAGGVSALALGAAYLIITVLYSVSGLVPEESGEAWLRYLDGKIPAWWAIVGLSALTDLLFFPVAAALYVVLRTFNRNAMLAGAGLLALFAVVDLAVTQLGFASLIVLSGDYAGAATDAERAAAVAAASYPVSVFRSTLFAAYVIGIPAVGVGIIGLVMRAGPFGSVTAWIGIIAGIVGIVSVVVPADLAVAPYVPILTAVLTLIWILLVGWRLVRLSGSIPNA